MCKVYNSIGSLTAIQHHLHQCHIKEFSTLYEVTDFQKNYFIYRRQIISNQERLTAQEKDLLSFEIPQLDDSNKKKRTDIENALRSELERLYQQLHHLPVATENTIRGFTIRLKKTFLKMRIGYKERNFNSKIERLVRHPSNILAKKIDRYQYIVTHFADAVNEGCLSQLKALERKKIAIDEVSTFIQGAIGEQSVVSELENLSDEYSLINDFSLSFQTPVYNHREKYYIKSIQIDHILVSPSGIFLIETKNWSKESINNPALWSPVQQIKRANFALYSTLNKGIANAALPLKRHHWGNRKIPIRNLIVLNNSKPIEEFEFVKILTVKDLPGYIKYFKPAFSNKETDAITRYLLHLIRQR